RGHLEGAGEQLDDHVQLREPRDDVHEHQHHDAREHLHGTSAVDEQQSAIEDVGNDADLQRILPPDGEEAELIEPAHVRSPRCRMDHATSSDSLFGRTSCTRNSRAPRARAATFAPTVPGTRPVGRATSLISPMNRLRDTPTSNGRPSSAIRGSPASTSSECSPRFAKPMPGSSTMASSGTPAARANASDSDSSRRTTSTTLPS